MEPQESLLSDELREELGDDSIIVGKKVKKESGPQVSEESLKIATKLSKAAKKRKLQVEIRKEKETQRQASFDLIKKHEISDAHRDLMRSSREIGQNMTHGQTVKHLFKKHRLGIELSEAELGTLLTTREEQLDKNEESGGFELKEEGIPSSQHINSNQDNTSAYSDMDTSDVNAPLIDLTSLLRSEETSNHEQSDVPKPSKKGSKKSKVRGKKDSEPTNESVGSTLLAKFNLLKEKLNKSSPHITPTSEVISKHNEPYPDNEVATNTTIYIPSSINLDALISRSGQVQNEARSDDNSVVTQSLLTKKKLIATILSNTETKLDASLRVTRKPVPVYRNASVQAARLGLPICRMEQEIVEAINENDVIVLCGETGSGKSTQIPQFLFEAGYTDFGRIAVTQPRRVAATSTADRVRFELCGDQSRQNSNSTKRCVSSPLTITSPSNGTQVHSELLGTLGLTGSRNTTLGRLKVLKVPPSNQSARFRLKVVNALEKKVQGLVKPTDSKKTTTKVNANTSFQSLPAGLVGHQIRFDSSTVGEDTHIVFMTDGILLREIASDLLLRRYCAVVVDEAHERGVNTDILLGMLSRAVLVRKKQAAEELSVWNRLSDTEKLDFEKPIQPLKIIIMSATLKISDFQNPKLFPEKLPPIVNVETRQYPVTVHFAKHTNVGNYLGEAFKKVTQIHKRLPAGGILVFLTGKREIQYLCRKLRTKLLKGWHSQEPTISATGDNTIDFEIGDVDDEDPYGRDDVDVEELENNDSFDDSEDDSDVDIDDDNDNDDTLNGNSEYDLGDDVPATKADGTEGDEEEAQSSDVRTRMLQSLFSDSSTIPAEATTEQSEPTDEPTTNSPVKLKPVILPLYAMLSAKQQNKIFQTLPPNCRLIVVATNVAETSITIPGIRYVIDCGRQKEQIRLMPSGIR